MKGQTAVEYLTTYGWMLLVIAIVGGAIFTTVQEQRSTLDIDQLENNTEFLSEIEDLTDYESCQVVDDDYDEHINCMENGTIDGMSYTIESQFNLDNQSGRIIVTNR